MKVSYQNQQIQIEMHFVKVFIAIKVNLPVAH